jgi:prolyl 4-hydroxylase
MIESIKGTYIHEGEYVAPAIKIIDNVFDDCKKFIDLTKDARSWSKARTGNDGEENANIRSTNEVSIPFGLFYPPEFFTANQIIFMYARHYAHENNFSFSHMEEISLLHYRAGEGFYESHYDTGPSMPRSMSALLYLNDVEDGGETYFDKFNLSIKPRGGRLALFPANYAYSHVARTPQSDDKYVLVTWFGQTIQKDVFNNYYPKDS